MDKVKIIAMYLPQYHEIPENNEFWGKGFTDWTTVKSAKQYFNSVNQPKIPINNNYYDLSKYESIEWQVNLAKEYGIDGFCFYHYWFSSKKQLLQKPSEIFLANKNLGIDFCFCWDNEPWKRTWDAQYGNAWSPIMDKNVTKKTKQTLVDFNYEDEEGWKRHFDYLLAFFKDERYIKIDNKPVFMFCNYYKVDELKQMVSFWNAYSKQFGFNGVCFIAKKTRLDDNFSDYNYFYQPHFSGWERRPLLIKVFNRLIAKIKERTSPETYDYEKIWQRIVLQAKDYSDKRYLYGAFVNYDDTPRRGEVGKVVLGKNEVIIAKYMQELVNISKMYDKEYIFLTAWNEWGEGAFLEPDWEDGFKYLEVIKKLKR
ncbi:MAG: glycoside hydrolase family 99-like domain-containing protein [Bacteroidales bacterium]|nr:glycoside hydrolase family 99-like domain-containing protein [Bacteroidales bacterium]